MSDDRVLEKLLEDLAEQCKLAARAAAEGRGDVEKKLLISFEMSMRAARAAAEKLAVSKDAGVRARAQDLVAAHDQLSKQTVSAMTHIAELAEGWKCARCKAAAPKIAKVGMPPDVGTPVLECRACSAETPVTDAGKAAFDRLFGHLTRAPVWNPRVNGFELKK